MKNLVIETQKTNIFDKLDFLPNEGYLCCYNCDNDRYYLLEKNGNRIIIVGVVDNVKHINRIDLLFEKEESKPIGLVYCSITQEFFIACDEGVVICMTHLSETEFKCQNVGDFTSGLQCISISPDHEMVVLLTKDRDVITLNNNLDVLGEASIKPGEFGEKQFITVGWGKKETQFHGSEGKAAAKTKAAAVGKTETDDCIPQITWKGDGGMFAISYIDQEVNARRFKVFNRDGVLQYTSELVDCLEKELSWKPSGNLLASTRKLPNKHTVALFEKNGLLHREFTLPFGPKDVLIQKLVWSRDSDILAIWCKELHSGKSIVQLWSEKNYHWYLKQTIEYPKENLILYVFWSSNINKDLVILSTRSSTVYNFHWKISHSYGKTISDKGAVGVIDGDKVLVTNFRDGIVPPPMAQQTIQFTESVNAISFAPIENEDSTLSSNDFLVLQTNNKVLLYKHVNESWESQFKLDKMYNIDFHLKYDKNLSSQLIQHLFWYRKNIILCSLSTGIKSCLCQIDLLDIDGLDVILVDLKTINEMPGQIEHIFPSSNTSTAYVVVNSKLYTFSDRDGLSKSDRKIVDDDSPTRALVQIQAVKFNDKEVIVALTRKHVMYVDGKQVSNNVTSFFVHSEFLLITTLQHTLISFKLDDNGLTQLCLRDLTIQPWNEPKEIQKSQELSIRRVERGSTIIMVIPKDAKTILQMPRGNLECIQPRALSIAIIGSFIDQLNYFQAFDLMRKQRIDLNLLHDHDPLSFKTNMEKFVKDVDNSSWLSLFLTELKDEDVTTTTYASSYGHRRAEESVPDKVDSVCEALRDIMDKNANDFVQPILISLVKNHNKDGLENALDKIKELKDKEERNGGGFSAEEALKYLLYMVDVNVLYDIALGMYDFELVMLVAQKSLKDPKEYIPYLNNLRQLEENYMKFTIDSYLKRHDSALEHIAQIPDKFNECLAFVQSHDLFGKALKLYSPKSDEYKKIAAAYGRSLLEKAKYREAGIMLYKANELPEALNAFKLSNSWKDAIVTAVRLNFNAQQMSGLYVDLVKQLREAKMFKEAAYILSTYLNRFEDSVATLCEGRHWLRAWTDAHCMKRTDLIETHVKPGILEHAEMLLGRIRESSREFERHKTRLEVVRAEAAARAEALKTQMEFDDETDVARGLSDLLSETTSIAGTTISKSSQASRSSKRTYRSSKNRRKHERKMHSVKKGSVYEDLALIRALHQLATNAYACRDVVRTISEMLLYINSDRLAEELHKELDGFMNVISSSRREIWPPAPNTNEPSSSVDESPQQSVPPNIIEPHLLNPPTQPADNWKLDMFLA